MTPRSLLAPARLAGQSVLRSQADERLVDLALTGSGPAFEAIVARYRGPLLGYCGRILDQGRAEDAVQQTFMRAHAALGRGEAVRKLRPWLYRIAHNTALNVMRDSVRAWEPLSAAARFGDSPDEVAERGQSLRTVLSAVQALPDRQRDAIVLRELEGRSHEEIARELGVSSGAARQLLNRARSSLRAGLTAVTPLGSVLRLGGSLGEAPMAARVAELCSAGGGSALAAKLCTSAVVAGVVAGGVAPPAPVEHAPKASSASASTAVDGRASPKAGGSSPAQPPSPASASRVRALSWSSRSRVRAGRANGGAAHSLAVAPAARRAPAEGRSAPATGMRERGTAPGGRSQDGGAAGRPHHGAPASGAPGGERFGGAGGQAHARSAPPPASAGVTFPASAGHGGDMANQSHHPKEDR